MRNAVPLVAIGCVTAIILGIIIGGVVMIGYGVSEYLKKGPSSETGQRKNDPNAPANPQGPKQSLKDARQGVKWTRLPVNFKQPVDGSPEDVADADVKQFPGPAGNPLWAYVSKPPRVHGKRPAVVWAHGGFGGIGPIDWKQAKAFHDAGFILMIPSFRKENGNAGEFEMFYGEVDDLLAAITYVSGLQIVDPSRIYVAGHGNGGTLVLLASVMGPKSFESNNIHVRAFFSIAGLPNVQEYFNASVDKKYEGQSPPFSLQAANDSYLRSASPFAGVIRKPTFYFGARTDEKECTEAIEMARNAEGRPFHALSNAANHANIVKPTINRLCEKIKRDIGSNCDIDFSMDDDFRSLPN